MKKISLALSGVALTGILLLGFNGSFTNQAVNIGDTGGAPQRPDLAYTHGDPGGGGVISNKSVKDPGTGSPAYSHGNTGGSPADNRGDGGSPSYAVHGDPGGGMVSNESIEDPGGSGSISNEAVEGPGVGGGIISNKSVGDPGGHIVSNEADGNTGIIAQA